MIKINKIPEPSILATNKAKWTTELMSYISTNIKVPKSLSNKYNLTEVKDSLRAECKSKCMYCESIVGHISFEHIEHIKPKARDKYPHLTFEYSNLGLACPKCNFNKSDTFDNSTPFINPYNDDPSIHFIAYGAWVWAQSGNDRAKLTELEIELNRPELLEQRGQRLKSVKELVDSYNRAPAGSLKAALKKEIEREISENKEYSFCAQQLAVTLME